MTILEWVPSPCGGTHSKKGGTGPGPWRGTGDEAGAVGSAGGWTGPVPVTVGPIEAIELRGTVVDLRTRALVAAVVPAPRFGREGEVAAGVQRAADSHADLADVSLEPRLIGPAARGPLPICARAGDLATLKAVGAAGAAVVMVRPDLAAEAAEAAQAAEAAEAGAGVTIAVVVDDVAQLDEARRCAERLGLALALDTSRRGDADAMAQEAAAIGEGCRLVRTADVRRTRRVVEVMAALLEARR